MAAKRKKASQKRRATPVKRKAAPVKRKATPVKHKATPVKRKATPVKRKATRKELARAVKIVEEAKQRRRGSPKAKRARSAAIKRAWATRKKNVVKQKTLLKKVRKKTITALDQIYAPVRWATDHPQAESRVRGGPGLWNRLLAIENALEPLKKERRTYVETELVLLDETNLTDPARYGRLRGMATSVTGIYRADNLATAMIAARTAAENIEAAGIGVRFAIVRVHFGKKPR